MITHEDTEKYGERGGYFPCLRTPPCPRQSSRNTMFGSTREARHAGSQQAIAATNVIVATTAAIVAGSVGSTPKRSDATTRFNAKAPARPMTIPTEVRMRPCFITWLRTLL